MSLRVLNYLLVCYVSSLPNISALFLNFRNVDISHIFKFEEFMRTRHAKENQKVA